MANEYTFKCPIKDEAVRIEDCADVHARGATGQAAQIEDKICALAHSCWMCPFRNAVRVGGPWSKPETMPRSDVPMANPGKLPADLQNYALCHAPPRDSDYRRCGMWGDDVGKHNEHFKAIHLKALGQQRPKFATTSEAPGLRAPVNVDARSSVETSQSAPKPKASSAPRKSKARASASSQTSTDNSKRMSLAERARKMKEAKTS